MNINFSKVKITVTVPPENAEEIRKAFGDSGAGVIGNYTYCSMSSACVGRFKGNEKSKPAVGTKNHLEEVEEIKIEVQCDVNKVKTVLRKLREVHPYEEPAIEIIPLIGEDNFAD